jgi:hypothetical protein
LTDFRLQRQKVLNTQSLQHSGSHFFLP